MNYVRLSNSVVVEVLEPVAGFSIEQCFHPDILAQCVLATEDVEAGFTYVDGVFIAPPKPTETKPE